MHTTSKAREWLRGRWSMAGALLCALVAAVAIALLIPPPPTIASPTQPEPPAAPTGFTAVLSGSSVSLSWTNPGDASISSYEYRYKIMGSGAEYGSWTQIPGVRAATTSHTIAVSESGRYNVQLRARNAGGEGDHAVASTGTPSAPSGLRAVLSSGSSLYLSWADPFDATISGYQYRVKIAGAANTYSAWTSIASSGASTTSATVTVTGSGRRVVQLKATNARGASSPASASTGPPAVPSGFSSPGGWSGGTEGEIIVWWAADSSSKGSVVLNWSDPGDDSIIKYQYSLRPARSGTVYSQWADIPGSGASTTSHEFVLPTHQQHRIKIRAVNGVGTAGLTINVHPTWPAPSAPSGLKASLSGSSVALSWNNPFNDTIGKYQYRIKKAGAANSYGEWTDIADSNTSTTSATITVTGTERRVVQLRATGRGTSELSSASTGPPAAPSGFTSPGGSSSGTGRNLVLTAAATSSKGSVTVGWSDPGDDSIIKYRYRFKANRSGAVYSQWLDIPGSGASTTSHEFVFSTHDQYRIKIQAVNGVGAADEDVNVKPAWPAPAAPSGLKASLSGNSVSLSWDNPFDHTISRYQYRIKKAGTANSYTRWTNIAGSKTSTVSAAITVTGTERRVVQLRAANVRGTSEPASASTGPPAAPSGLTSPEGSSSGTEGRDLVLTAAASSSKGSVTVNWSDPGDDSIIKYRYSFGAAQPSSVYSGWVDIPGSGASTTSHKFVLPAPEQYRIKIQAVNSLGSAEQTVTVNPAWPAPAVPSGLKAVLNSTSVSLSWDNPYDASISGYQYRIKTAGTTNAYGAWTNIASSDASTVSHTIAVTGTERRVVQLRATRPHSIGGHGNPATTSTTAPPAAPAPTPLLAPDAPSGLKASGGNGVIDMYWSNPSNTSITGYQYQIIDSSTYGYSAWQSITGSSASTVSFTIPSLTVNTGYRVRLRAGNAAGWGRYAVVSTRTGVTHSPAGPITTPGDGSFTLSWDVPPATYGITGYRVTFFPHHEYDDVSSYTRVNLPGSSSSYTATGLGNGTQYRIWLSAVSAAGRSGGLTLFATPAATTTE